MNISTLNQSGFFFKDFSAPPLSKKQQEQEQEQRIRFPTGDPSDISESLSFEPSNLNRRRKHNIITAAAFE